MEPFFITADVFSLEFPDSGRFQGGGIDFLPKTPWYLKSINRRLYHVATGKASFFLVAASWADAIEVAYYNIYRFASEALTFAQSRRVFFHNLRCEDKGRVFNFAGESRIGFPIIRRCRISPNKTASFLDEVIPKISSKEFREKTRVFEALAWLNETIISTDAIEELKFSMLWLALETLASAFASTHKTSKFLRETEWKSLRETVHRWSRKHLVGVKVEELLSNLGRIQEKKSTERIMEFTRHYAIPFEKHQLSEIVRIRNLIQHVPWSARHGLQRTYDALEELVEYSICTVLKIKPQEYLVRLNHMTAD